MIDLIVASRQSIKKIRSYVLWLVPRPVRFLVGNLRHFHTNFRPVFTLPFAGFIDAWFTSFVGFCVPKKYFVVEIVFTSSAVFHVFFNFLIAPFS